MSMRLGLISEKLMMVVAGLAMGVFVAGEKTGGWTAEKKSVVKEKHQDVGRGVLAGIIEPDKVKIIHSELKNKRLKRSPDGPWRKPREYQFVTRERSYRELGNPRSARLLEPEFSASRYYPEERPYYPHERMSQDYFRRRSDYQTPHKRIIYYATLPEIVRRPGEWTPPRPINGGGFPYDTRENEVLARPDSHFIDTGTRVLSSIIGFSNQIDSQKNPNHPTNDYSTPKFTIIDVEPPYNYGHRPPLPPIAPPPDRYDMRFGQDKYDFNRYDQRPNSHINYADPYRNYNLMQQGPPRHPQVALPPQPITVVRKPLDVRPLDPENANFSTQSPPHISSTQSSTSSSTSTTTSSPISNFERTYKF